MFKLMIGNISIIVLYMGGFRDLRIVDCESNERYNEIKRKDFIGKCIFSKELILPEQYSGY
jgi:hypothetical protein